MDNDLATQLASAISATSEREFFADADTAEATFTVKERFGRRTVNGRIPVRRADVSIDQDGLPSGTASLALTGIQTPNARRDRDLQGGASSPPPPSRCWTSARSAPAGRATRSSSTAC